WVFIGIESPDEEALRETRKLQNTRENLLQSIRNIYSYGIDIYAGFIIGFDADDRNVFERQFRFILESGIILSAIGLLTAIPETPLFDRLKKANRLRSATEYHSIRNNFAVTNVIPLQMTYEDMLERFRVLQKQLIEEKNLYQRIFNKFMFLRNPSKPFQISF